MSESPDLRVMLLTPDFQARGRSVYTLRLAEHLPDLGVGCFVITPDASNVDAALQQKRSIQEYPHLGFPLLSPLGRRWLLKDLQQAPPQVIHVQSRRILSLGTWLARRLEVPYIVTVHDYLLRGEKLRFDWRYCRGVIAVSESVKRDLIKNGLVPADRIRVIRSGVEVHPPENLRLPFEPGKVPVVGTAGPLEVVKGIPYFLGAACKVLATGRDVEFLVAGAGPEEANLRRLARELGITRQVTFVPYLLEFTQSLAAMDIFCLPSLQQGLGSIMLEAMALGRPVIASRVGGAYSIVHDQQTGLLVPPSDSGALADRIIELISDPIKARALGGAAQQMVYREFTFRKTAEETVAFYRHVLAGQVVPAC